MKYCHAANKLSKFDQDLLTYDIHLRQNLKMALEMGVTPRHLRTSYLEEGCLGSWKMIVVSLNSL